VKQRKSILFISQFYHPHIGGVEKHIENLVENLNSKKCDVTILTEQYNASLSLDTMCGKARVIRIPTTSSLFLKKFYIWKWVLFHVSYLRAFDVIHIHDVFYYILPFRLLLFGKKIYMTFHGYEGFPLKKRWIIARKIAEKMTSGNICVGDFMKKWYGTNATELIYGAVSISKVKFKEKPLSAVFFGRLDDQTGILEYVKAYKILKKRFGKFSLTVVGEGKLKSKIPKEIKVVPFTSNIEPLIGAHRFIFVSRYLSMLEGLIQKKEIVAVYDNEVKKDYLLMSPFKKYVFVAKNSKEIVEIVEKCIIEPEYSKKLTENGYDWAQKISWDAVANVYLRLWGFKK